MLSAHQLPNQGDTPMRRLNLAAAAAVVLAAGLLTGPAAFSSVTPGSNGIELYVGNLTSQQVAKLPAAVGIDLHDTAMGTTKDGKTKVELAITPKQAAKLQHLGMDLSVKKIDGKRASTLLDEQATNSTKIYRSYSEPGGIRDELIATAAQYPQLAKLEAIGKSVNGQTIYALKVTKNARSLPDGYRPAVLYQGAQHAREWITPEMVRRLMHDTLANYGNDPTTTELVKSTEMWFIPVVNVDGHYYTFTEGNRLWRKNLRDNNGDGQIGVNDGVDPNRNYPTHWGYDNEGSSNTLSSETYRGTGPASEPETRAIDGLAKRIGFKYAINYHSAAELLLYGTGWQVSTPTPDDLVYEALAGNDEHPAVPGYDPDISAELYTTNGETTEHLQEAYHTLAFTPEMSTCQTASAVDPNDEWDPATCASVFNFPEDEDRGTVKGQKAGDSVEVWFSGLKPGTGPVSSKHFTYAVSGDTGSDVLILAAEDTTGASPAQGGTAAKYVSFYQSTLTAAGYSSDVYDMDTHGRKPPHPLGVLSHYKAVVWETGDDIIPRYLGQPGGTAAKSALDTELAVRDYLNEGGKLLMTGQYNGFAQGANGVYDYNPFAPPQCTTPDTYPCLPLFNDFEQYYLGAYTYVSDGGTGDDGNPYPVTGTGGAFDGFDGTFNGGDSADNQGHTASFLTTSSFLPPAQFPQFSSSAPIGWVRPGGAPYDPHTGAYYLNSQQADRSYKRLTRTVDLTGASSGSLKFWTSYDTETDWDYQFVEAHTVGQDDWTTLPDANGHTSDATGESCAAGWVDAIHPHHRHLERGDR